MQHTRAAAQARWHQRIAMRRNARVKLIQQQICEGKRRFGSQRNASYSAVRWRLHSYKCPICKGWHLSSQA